MGIFHIVGEATMRVMFCGYQWVWIMTTGAWYPALLVRRYFFRRDRDLPDDDVATCLGIHYWIQVEDESDVVSSSTVVAAASACAVIATLVAVHGCSLALFIGGDLDHWPFSTMPMFASYVDAPSPSE